MEAENAALAERVKQLESSLKDMQAELETQHNKVLDLQSQAAYAQQQAPTEATEQPASPKRGFSSLAWGGLAVLAGLCAALILRLRRRMTEQADTEDTAIRERPVFKEAPPPAVIPVSAAPAPAPARSEVEAIPEATATATTALLPSVPGDAETQDMDIQAAIDKAQQREPVNTSEADTQRLSPEEEAAAERLRQEIAAAWSIPQAEEYQRFDDTETSLAEALARGMEDTVKLRAAAEAAAAQQASDNAETMIAPTDTAMLPAATLTMPAPDTAATAPMKVPTPPVKPSRSAEGTKLDYNLSDLDRSQSAQHVQMPSMLNQPPVLKERRTNLVDVLKLAIEKEPDRHDLRMKLLETYYAAAATNRQGFLDAVQKLSASRDILSESDWLKVQQMARHISADTVGLTGEDDENLADCA
jgi:hypothetical protein